MEVFRILRVLGVLCIVGTSLCVDEIDYDGNYIDNYDNEISQDQQEGEAPTVDFSHWDKLFITLEDSHMRQKLLLDSLEQCFGGMVSLKTQVDKLVNKGTCQQCLPSLETACRVRAERVGDKLHQGMLDLQEEEAKRERRLNATLQQLLHSGHEGNARLKRLEEGKVHRAMPSGAAGSRMNGHQPTPRPGGLGAVLGLGVKPSTSGSKEQEINSQMDVATMQRALVAIATDLQKVHLQLSRLIEQTGRTNETQDLTRGKK